MRIQTGLLHAVFLVTGGYVLRAAEYTLPATPSTVVWGYYSAQAKPALKVHSGDTVRIQTASACPPPARLEAAGVRPADIPQYLREIHEKVTDKGPGGHILTGPVAIEEAAPGDVLEVQIQKIRSGRSLRLQQLRARARLPPERFPIWTSQDHPAGP
ncbi:MAG: acetamidase [Bryobacterales bacterium]|nr:acetamidase [Bryobacterales bacterium]